MTNKVKAIAKAVSVGVDVSKDTLDVDIHERDFELTVDNNETGIKDAIIRLKRYKICRVVVEATGRYEHAFVQACYQADLPIVIANPRVVRRYAGGHWEACKDG